MAAGRKIQLIFRPIPTHNAIGFLIGQAMKASRRQGTPALFREIFEVELK